ncbi:MAG TPA: universal stress protein [Steroidobacteraceae bacterium]|jgi:nucleotide-binding universal stress UspA family protein|nr:universal stress protein [Steroidobacteraceae bacterium]
MSSQPGRILAATDFSPAADRAARRAASVAATLGDVLHLAHILPPAETFAQLFADPASSEAQAFRSRAERALEERAQRLADRYGVKPVCELHAGHAAQAILDLSESLAAHLIVLGARGEREGVSLLQTVGDTAVKVAERARVATLLVRREAEVPYGRVFACVKGVPADRSIVAWANRVSPADLIHIASAYSVPYEWRLVEWGASQRTLETYAARERESRTRALSELLRECGLPAARAQLHIERGEPLPTILQIAGQWHADVLILGRRAEADSLSAAGQFGSIARRIAFHAPMDVMIVPPALAHTERSVSTKPADRRE